MHNIWLKSHDEDIRNAIRNCNNQSDVNTITDLWMLACRLSKEDEKRHSLEEYEACLWSSMQI